MLKVGLENLKSLGREKLSSWGRCGLLANQASITQDFTPSWFVCRELLGKQLTCLFGPQHGFEATVQDNMIETEDARHLATGLPVFSLYSHTREPTEKMMQHLDTLIIDLQIVGCRIYTFKATIAACLRSAKAYGKKVVVLDRPNPLGGEVVEGRVLDPAAKSFVGPYPIPMRHALTACEAAQYFNKDIKADLEVVPLSDWIPSQYYHETARNWVITSPNLPTIDPVYVFPGMVIFEGTNVSEGRGTGLPFQFIGAPFIKDPHAFVDRIEEINKGVQGVYLRPCSFQPTSQKWQDQECQGLQIHVLDPHQIRSFNLALSIVAAAREFAPQEFQWKEPPYEYDHETLPMKLIIGSHATVDHFDSFSIEDPFWHEGLEDYMKAVKDSLIYDRKMILPF